MDSTTEARFEEWAVVELMGHVRIAGRLTEEERFGTKLGRIDIPRGEGFVTQYFGGASVYRVTPVSEEAARAVARRSQPEPVHRYELLPAPESRVEAMLGSQRRADSDVGHHAWTADEDPDEEPDFGEDFEDLDGRDLHDPSDEDVDPDDVAAADRAAGRR